MDTRAATGAATVPLSADDAVAVVAEDDEAGELAPGTNVGRYVVLERIGAGGMGVVHAAFDPQLDRRLALKRVRVAGARARERQDRRERLGREARAMAKLAHPNVVTVYDVGTLGDEVWIAMELVEGATLRQWVATETPDWRRVTAVMIGAARGLAAAHDAGIVHRDFKPDNVLVDRGGRARVADFGLARAHWGESLDPSVVSEDGRSHATITAATEDGVVLGTPAYMAPELHDGGAADAKSDQFAFCVALFELLYGERPFEGERREDLSQRAKSGRLREPTLSRGVPGRLRRVLARGLAADPHARWPSMHALATALERDPIRRFAGAGLLLGTALGSAGLVASLTGAGDRCGVGTDRIAEVWSPAHAQVIRESFAATLLPYAGLASDRTTAALDDYGTRWAAAHRSACEATEVRGEQSGELLDLRMACLDHRHDRMSGLVARLVGAGIDDVVHVDEAVAGLPDIDDCSVGDRLRGGAIALDDADRARVAEVERLLGAATDDARANDSLAALDGLARASTLMVGIDHPALAGELALAEGRIQRRLGATAKATDALQRARTLAEAGADDGLRLSAQLELAEHTATASELGSAREQQALAAAIWHRLTRPPTREHEVLDVEAVLLRAEGRFAQAREIQLRVHELAQEHAPHRAALALGRLAAIEAELARFADAEEHAQEALASAEARLGAGHPTVAQLRLVLAAVLGHQLKWQAAEASITSARDELVASFGPEHPRVADAELALANALRHRAANDEALALYRHVLRIRSESTDVPPLDLANAHSTLGVHLMGLGQREEALEHYDAALAIRMDVLGARHPDVGKLRTNRAAVLGALGRDDEAEADLREALVVREDALGPDHPDIAYTLEALGNLLVRTDRDTEAEPLLRRALAIREDALGRDHVLVATTSLNLGVLELERGAWTEARRRCERALAIREATLAPDHPDLVYALDCLGSAALGLGETAAARTAFARALALLEHTPGRDALWGEASFGLARASASTEPRRAVELARAARSRYAKLGASRARVVAEIDAWLAEQAG